MREQLRGQISVMVAVGRLEPDAFDLQAEVARVISRLSGTGPVQTKPGCLIDCRISKALKAVVSDNRCSRELVGALELRQQ